CVFSCMTSKNMCQVSCFLVMKGSARNSAGMSLTSFAESTGILASGTGFRSASDGPQKMPIDHTDVFRAAFWGACSMLGTVFIEQCPLFAPSRGALAGFLPAAASCGCDL